MRESFLDHASVSCFVAAATFHLVGLSEVRVPWLLMAILFALWGIAIRLEERL